jgi:hypothetical protein
VTPALILEFLGDVLRDPQFLALFVFVAPALWWWDRRRRRRAQLAQPAAPTLGELHLAALKLRTGVHLDAYAHRPTQSIRIENGGLSEARAVTLTVLDEAKHPFEGEPPFPLARLGPGEMFAHPGSFTMGQIPFPARLEWVDPDGTRRERTLDVPLRFF